MFQSSETPATTPGVTGPPADGSVFTPRRSSRWPWMVGGAAVLVVLSIALAWVVFRREAPEFPAPSGPFTFTIRGYDVESTGGATRAVFHVAKPTSVSAAYQRAPVFRDGDSEQSAELIVYRPRVFDADALPEVRFVRAEDVDVAGRPGMLLRLRTGTTMLVWEYTTDAWATLEADALEDSDLELIAAGLRPGPQLPAKLPFALGYVPAGYVPIEVTEGASPGGTDEVLDLISAYGGVLLAKPAPHPKGLTNAWGVRNVVGSLSVSVERGDGKAGAPARSQPYCEYPGHCIRWSPDSTTKIILNSDKSLSYDEAIRVLLGVQLAAVDKPDSWPLATDALPR